MKFHPIEVIVIAGLLFSVVSVTMYLRNLMSIILI